MPLFTILTPVFNHEQYLEECILSAIGQSFPDWEMIILNDGSTDKTAELASGWVTKDARITLLNQPNHGIFRLAETYNKGLKLARGKYISILEGDDCWNPDKLLRQKDILDNHPEVMVAWGCAKKFQAETGQDLGIIPIKDISKPESWSNRPIGSVLNALYIENMIPAVTITIRKSALNEIGGFIQPPEFPTTDLPTLMELSLKGTFFFDETILANWRIYSTQTTKLYPVEMITRRYEMISQHFDKLEECFKKELVITKEMIDKYFNDKMLDTYARSGRYRLLRKDFSGARNDYLHAIFYKGKVRPMWRIRAITGLIFSLFHKDVEGLSRMFGKVSYKS